MDIEELTKKLEEEIKKSEELQKEKEKLEIEKQSLNDTIKILTEKNKENQEKIATLLINKGSKEVNKQDEEVIFEFE